MMTSALSELPPTLTFLAGGGEMGRLIRGHDWASTPLGPAENWPQSLRTAVRIMLTSRQPIWIGWGFDLIYLYNDAYHSIIGGKHPWALGKPTHEVWSEIWSEIGPLLTTAMGGVEGTYVEEKLLIMERNGYPEETYYTFSYSPIPDDDGTPGGIICANTDDTRRVIGERQLTLLRRVSDATVEARSWRDACQLAASGIGSDASDLPFALLYVRRPGDAQFTLAAATGIALGHPAAPGHLSLDGSAPWPVLAALTEGRAQIVKDWERRLGEPLPSGPHDKSCQTVAVLPIALKGEGEALLIAGLNPYRLLDGEYRAFLDGLAHQIADAISNADAYEAERRRSDALAELDRAKTAFFSNVSHEFRTPLTLMLGPLEDLLHANVPEPERPGLIEVAHRNGVRLLRLVNSLLDFSRIEAGRAKASFQRTDLAAVTREIASTFRSAVEKVGMTLEVEAADLPEPAFVDRDMWEKILLNLLSNAFKFTLSGGIRVSIAAAPGAALITVADTGAGIPAAELPHLFERFHRVENQPSRSFEGSGIGLALVQELVKLHYGEITVESVEGKGSAFTIVLPLGKSHLPADQIGEAEDNAGQALRAEEYVAEARRWTPAAAGFGMPDSLNDARPRVLVADDNADMRDYVERLLSEHWRVETAPDGKRALTMIRQSPPDLLLTDVMMPELDGFGLLAAVRGDPALRDLPVIMLSARAGEEAHIDGLEAGADDYLTKPFTARELVARVDSNLKLAAIRAESKAEISRREADLRDLNALLGERVEAEVAKRLKAEEALRQAYKMEAVGRLTGGIAHDFNNLLTVILGGLDTLSRAKVAEEGRPARALDMALQGAQRASSLTARLLAFSRQQPLDPKPIELSQLVLSMSEILHRALGEQIILDAVLPIDLWRVEIDQNQLESALLNLAVNARDAMEEGGRLTIAARNVVLEAPDTEFSVVPGDYVGIAISDTGHGMSPETAAQAFDPFFTTKATGQGTGLGLSMVYGFAKQSGGHITIDSEEGAGTTVTLFFPRHHGKSVPLAPQLAGSAPPAREGEVVLVLEDNDDVRLYSTTILSELGYTVLEACNGPQALAVLDRPERIDLLFTDIVLPGMSGKAVADQATARYPDLKVLFATGYSRDAVIHHGRIDPGVNLLQKPFTYEQVASRIREILDR